MESKRTEVMPGVWLTQVKTDTLPCSSISINFLAQLQRETVSQNALIPHVLACGSSRFASRDSLTERFSALGGIEITPVVRKFGEIQSIGLKMLIPNGAQLSEACRLLCSMIVSPATKGGLLVQKYVDEQKELLADADSDIEDISADTEARCISQMCCYEDYSTPVNGIASDLCSIYYKKLTRSYQDVLQTAPVEIIACVPTDCTVNFKSIMRSELSSMPRGEIDYDIGTDIRMNSVAETLRIVTDDEQEGTEYAFSLGCRLGECMDDPDFAAIKIASEVIQSQVSLISGYRDVSVSCDLHKGLLLINGICPKSEPAKLSDDIRVAILKAAAADACKAAFEQNVKAAVDKVISSANSADELECFTISATLLGVDFTPDELAAIILDCSPSDVAKVLNSIEFDLICLSTIS